MNRQTPLRAGETYDLVMEYYQLKGKAIAYLVWEPILEDGISTREVFIPAGAWYNVFTGEKFVGPATVTITGKTDEMPVFVREGAVIPTSPVISPMQGGHWENISINIYGLSETSFTIYEDDGETESYIDGSFRKTEVTVRNDGKNWCIDIGAANGDFATEYDTRIVKLRIHSDKPIIGAKRIAKDKKALPFANEGASRISDVYEITASVDLSTSATVTLDMK